MSETANMSVSTHSERFHDLDAVRAGALLLGVALHTTMSFIEPQVWLIKDANSSTGLAVLFYVIHMFRMMTFFVMAGFFAHMLMSKRGLGGFIKNRLIRVGAPLAIFWPIVFASIIAIMIIAFAPPPGAPAVPAAPPPPLSAKTFPLTHLWFLYALLWLYGGAVVLKLVTDVLHIGKGLGRMLDAVVGFLTRTDLIGAVLILPAFAALYANPAWLIWFGIPTPDAGVVINTSALSGFATAFAFGWFLHRSPDLLAHLARRWWAHLSAAVIGTVICLNMVGITAVITPAKGSDHPIYLALYLLTGWSWTLGLIGAAHAFLKRENPVLRYLSDASYWIYILHIPVVMGLQLAVRNLPGPAELKFGGVLLATVMIGLLTYQIMVRYTFIGAILNGRRRKVKRAGHGQEALLGDGA
ncbi:acyltransferase family protein [Asticcacaulis taihuensis]|uniref:Glucans biosynthesis protein C n=1 Tax=Asticcacaulis taihuensis TaxID=260084 RepID=A0A1G4SQT5_9CAUL|nr:acyltransferase family protein [Asticcacaulis taihuensis]SCW71493.1 glucans biosynthesis protein C [Asticcacaulis taihuensis]